MSYNKLIYSYYKCIKNNVLKAGRDRSECLERLVKQLVALVNKLSDSLGSKLALRIVDNITSWLGLLVVRGRLVYRARPGGGEVVPPIEYGLRLHPVFLVPFIPGSSVKGAMRAAYASLLESKGVNEKVARRCVEALFGASEGVLSGISGVVVFDAYPVEPGVGGVFVVGDVLTPHYPLGKRLVTELDAKPVPVRGISVAEGTRFLFTVGVDEDYVLERLGDQRGVCLGGAQSVPMLVLALLVAALENMGVGGKTTRGYGFFRVEDLRVVAQTRSRAKLRGFTRS